jgi:predicted transcriptional regulator
MATMFFNPNDEGSLNELREVTPQVIEDHLRHLVNLLWITSSEGERTVGNIEHKLQEYVKRAIEELRRTREN